MARPLKRSRSVQRRLFADGPFRPDAKLDTSQVVDARPGAKFDARRVLPTLMSPFADAGKTMLRGALRSPGAQTSPYARRSVAARPAAPTHGAKVMQTAGRRAIQEQHGSFRYKRALARITVKREGPTSGSDPSRGASARRGPPVPRGAPVFRAGARLDTSQIIDRRGERRITNRGRIR